MPAKKIHGHTFVVTGKGQFPIDMLRYDRCFPQGQDDVLAAFSESAAREGLTRGVRMASDREIPPTDGRWRSFGWTVSQVRPWYNV